tara:strand:- start:5068 stop:6369 length:1302 start_codon:yes stop_codon:yes gene_type:complete
MRINICIILKGRYNLQLYIRKYIMIEYIFTFIIFIFLFFFAYIKLKYPFWSCQPMFHDYDVLRRLCSVPFVINKYGFSKNKYCNVDKVKTNEYIDCKEENKNIATDLVQSYYLNTDQILHTIQRSDIDSLMSGSSNRSFMSIFFEKELKCDTGSLIQEIKTPSGIVFSRPLSFWYTESTSDTNYIENRLYLIDYLCVHRGKEQKQVYRELLQTHLYNQQNINKNVNISLIKKEIALFEGVVPFVSYHTYTFKLRNHNIMPLPPHYYIIELEKENFDVLVDFLYTNKDYCYKTKLYDVLIFPDIGNIQQMVACGLLKIFCLRNRQNIYGFYFFKDAKMYYEEIEGNTLHFIGSIMNCLIPTLFYNGFLNSLKKILKKDSSFMMLLFEDIGHNCILYEFWKNNYLPVFTNKTAYYLHNFIHPKSPLDKKRVFVLL